MNSAPSLADRSSRRLRAASAAVAAAGVAGYVAAALAAPVVLWSDSRVDLALARERLGFLGGAAGDPGGSAHAIKPAYLLFLAFCSVFRDPARLSVVLQSMALAGTIVAVGAAVRARRGAVAGIVFLVLTFGMLYLRDAASAVMSEALASAGFLALTAAAALDVVDSDRRAILAGAAAGALFWVRPNVGAAAAVVLAAGLLRGGRMRGIGEFARAARLRGVAGLAAGFLAVWFPVAAAARLRPHPPARSGATSVLLTGSLDYAWPALGSTWPAGPTPAATARAEIDLAGRHWRAMWPPRTPEVRRQWAWRAFHALLGGDYYDAGWSGRYRALDEWSRVARPFLVIAAAALVLAAWRSRATRRLARIGTVLIVLLVAQSLAIGALPRFGLPYLAPLVLVAVLAAGPHFGLAALIAAAAIGAVRLAPGVVDREWGNIERAGVVIRQRIPARAISPARPELHIRVGSLTGATTAQLSVLDDAGRVLFSSTRNPHPEEPVIVVPIPDDDLARNRDRAIEIRLVSSGRFDESNFYVFPLVPPPWSSRAVRDGSRDLSPETGIRAGSLDWW